MTQLDVCRARTFVAAHADLDVNDVFVPVVGGHAGTTIVPLLSQTTPAVTFSDEERAALTQRIMFGGDEVRRAGAPAAQPACRAVPSAGGPPTQPLARLSPPLMPRLRLRRG